MTPTEIHSAEIVGAAVVVALSVASAALYARDHRAADYAKGGRAAVASPQVFARVYAYIRYSTLVAGVGALLSGHAAWLVMFRTDTSIYAGILTATLGFAMFVAARRALGRHYSPCFDRFLPESVVQDGLYGRIRHPIYTANLITLTGLFVLTGSVWLAVNVSLLAWFYGRSAVAEERELAAAHPDYREYVARTGRFLPAWGRSAG